MNTSPVEIRTREFRQTLRGVDGREVRQFLESIAEDLEAMLLEKAALQEETRALKGELAKYTELESNIQKTMQMAQKVSDEMVETAKKQAEIIVEESRLKGQEIEREFERIKASKRQFMLEYQILLEKSLENLRDVMQGESRS